jgi:hypothetical protein
MGFIIIIDSKEEANLRARIQEVSSLPLYKIGEVVTGHREVRLI